MGFNVPKSSGNHTETARARQALNILREYYNKVIDPHYAAKIDKLPDKPGYDRMASRLSSRSLSVSSALNTIEGEIDRMSE